MTNVSQEQLKQWHFTTQCGRNFVWAAYDLEQLMRDIIRTGYRATFVEEYTEYQVEVRKIEQQEVLNAELTKAAEGGEAA